MPPKKGESKQDWLGRCSKEKRAAGMSEDKALAACVLEWNQERMAAEFADGRVHLVGEVDIQLAAQAAEGEQQARDRFAILAYTGKVVDRGWARFIIDLKGMALAKDKVPCLYLHRVDGIVGTIDKSLTDKTGFIATGDFSKVPESKGPMVLQHANEDFPWQASIGVQRRKVLQVAQGEKYKVNGQTVEGPIEVWLESTVFEVSFVPFGADDDTAAIAMSADGKTISPEENDMPETITVNLAGQPGTETPPPAAAPVPDAAALEAARAEGEKLARQEAADLLLYGQTIGLSTQEIQGVLALGLPKAKATEKLLELGAQNRPPVGSGGRLEMGADEKDKYRLAASHGLQLRLGGRVENPAPGNERFRGLTLVELAKDCLRRMGVNVEGMSPAQAAQQILRLSAGPMSSSDFAAITMDAVNLTLQRAYAEAVTTWRSWCNVVPATNFKEIYGVALSEAPDLKLVTEGGEYKSGALKDKKESYHVGKYGIIIGLTEEMIINDDTRAFTRIPQLGGSAAARKVNELVYGLLTGATVMKEDGKTLFHADHLNLASGDAIGVPSSTTLSAMRKGMRNQKGLNGAVINPIPKYLLIPTGYETSADILLMSAALPESGMSSAVKNPWAGKLTPISDPMLDAADEDAWYLAADPAQMDTIEVAFLDGNQAPTLTEDEEFRRDVLSMKVKLVVGVGAMDFRGLAKNPGTSGS